ncbi:MAG TPA: hypothetical protein PKY01_13855 [Candidatus Hydrogenedentes bacterium]|nr:hypothetical protein [Candidatus Hydrogenedentota bacterium]
MNTLQTFRIWLEPDELFPQFKRLAWELVEVSIRDVLTGGVHPWATNPVGTDVHPSLADAFLQRLNNESAKVTELDGFGYCQDVSAQRGYCYVRKSRFEQVLEYIQKDTYFVENLTYMQLLDIAKRRLHEMWNHRTARTLAERAYTGFQELRQFLKAKSKSIKLSGYGDIDRYDLGEALSLEDFEGRDSLLISQAIPSLNFRKASWLAGITDGRGRLRLAPDIRKVTLTAIPDASDYVHLVWHVVRDGETCRFRPEIGKSDAKRSKARDFAEQWRMDDGRLCFSTSLDRLSQMVEQRTVTPSFPTLNYTCDYQGPVATAEVTENRVSAFFIGGFYNAKSNGEVLKEILREYGVSMTGNKDALLRKLAELAARKYAEWEPKMDAFFSEHRFVRIGAFPPKSERLPVLEDQPMLRNLLLTMYALKHLRGNAILDVAHDNNTYSEEQLALALIEGKVGFAGSFLRVA